MISRPDGRLLNKQADTALKNERRRWQPIKAVSAAFGAGVAVASGLIAATTWVVLNFVR